MTEFPVNPLFSFLYWLLDTPGVGAVFVALLGSGMVVGYFRVLRWIADGAKANERAVYTYPTEGLHHQKE